MFKKPIEVFLVFLRLGLTSFGGPTAHIGYFHDEFVTRRKWINEQAYADLVALCQFLPGPASSQVGMALGLNRAGILGSVLAWIGFTAPSAIVLVLFALGIEQFQVNLNASWLHTLKITAVAVVAQAIWNMGVKLCPDKKRASIASLACIATLSLPTTWTQILVIIASAMVGKIFLNNVTLLPHVPLETKLSKTSGLIFIFIFIALLIALPLIANDTQAQSIKLFDSFYRAGSLVFGGGHVVLPLLQAEAISSGWVSSQTFMAGYGAAQAIPGPLFSFSAYLGAISNFPPNGWLGAAICLVAVFLPSFLLIFGGLPFWEKFRQINSIRQAMLGVNAAVVGLLISAFYNPVWTSGILNAKDFALALLAFALLTFWKTPSWIVVIVNAGIGILAL